MVCVVCVCVCVCVYLAFIMFWGPNVLTRLVIPVHFILCGLFLVPMKKQAYKSYSIKFLENQKFRTFPVKGRFRCRVGVGQGNKKSLYCIKSITSMECPNKTWKDNVCVCVCVCVCACLCGL